jgi:tetratricopeptide (TPR) repeat protein
MINSIRKLLVFILFAPVCCYAQKHGQAAIDSMKKDLATMHQPADSNKAKVIYRIADAYTRINPDSSLAYSTIGLTLVQKLNWGKGIGAFNIAFGNVYSDKSDYKRALKYYQEAYKISMRVNNLKNAASSLINIGSTYQRMGNFPMSIKYSFKALKIAEQIKAEAFIAILNNNIANIYHTQHDFKKALSYNFKALASYQKMGDQKGIAQVYKSIGNSYHERKNLSIALNYYTRSIEIYRTLGDKLAEAEILSQIALIYDTNYDKKLGYMLKAEALFNGISPTYIMAITNVGNIGGTYADVFIGRKLEYGKTYQNIPDNYPAIAQKALLYLNKAVKLSTDAGDSDNLGYFSDELAQLQERLGDYKNALHNYRQSRAINDSLYSQENKNKIANMSAEFIFQKKENAYLQQQQVTKFRFRQMLLYAALGIVLVSLILMFFLNRARLGQLKLKNELQRREAEERTKELLHQNKLSETELRAIRAQMNPHFIFNVLNSIESYILDNDPRTASRLVQKFATLSRLILENSTQSMVVASREWRALQLYTELEAMRFNNQFDYSFEFDPVIDLNAIMLPPMLVQPLIENAIHHGLRNLLRADGRVEIRLTQTDHELIFTVYDNGIGIQEAAKFRSRSAVKIQSIGLTAIRERVDLINAMNGTNTASFELREKIGDEGPGTIATLKLPKVFRTV